MKHRRRTSYSSNRAGKLPPGKEDRGFLQCGFSLRGMKRCIRPRAFLIRLKLRLISCRHSSGHNARLPEERASLVTNLRAHPPAEADLPTVSSRLKRFQNGLSFLKTHYCPVSISLSQESLLDVKPPLDSPIITSDTP